MQFGEKLRSLRKNKDLTQPELAEALGIEQSYLSKLENGKSIPSNDVLNRILDVFSLTIGDLVDDLDQGVRNQLRQIPDVATHFNNEKQQLIGNRRRWLLVSAALIAIGISLGYAGSAHMFYPNIVYQYMSHGVVLDGESKEIFVRDQYPRDQRSEQMIERRDEDFLTTWEYRGNVFNVSVDGGSRTYYFDGERETDPWQNKGIVFLGLLLGVFGSVGLLLERKLSK